MERMDWETLRDAILGVIRQDEAIIDKFPESPSGNLQDFVKLCQSLVDLVDSLRERTDIIPFYSPFFHHAMIDLTPTMLWTPRFQSLSIAAVDGTSFEMYVRATLGGTRILRRSKKALSRDECIHLLEKMTRVPSPSIQMS